MPNSASVVKPTPGDVPAGTDIAGIEVDASGTTDSVDAPRSTVGTLKGGVYNSQANLMHQGGTIYVPDSGVTAPSGKFKIRADVQFTNGGMDTEIKEAGHVGEFNGTLFGKPPKGRPKPKPRRRSESKRAESKPAKGSAKRGAKKPSRPALKRAAKAKPKSAAKKTKTATAKRSAARPKRKK